jgi:hypothetical protein
MIGAVKAKKRARSGFDALNQHNVAKSMSNWAEDATYTMSG